MKFILKDRLIHIVGNHGLPNNNIEGTVEGPEGYVLEFKINNQPYKKVTDNKIHIPKEALQKTSIELTFRAVKGDKIQYFKSDKIPLLHTIVFGGTLEEKYPEIIQHLERKVVELEKFIYQKERSLKNTMTELVETFEEIIRKGSLF